MAPISRPSYIMYVYWDGRMDSRARIATAENSFSIRSTFVVYSTFHIYNMSGKKKPLTCRVWLAYTLCLQVWLIGNHQGRYRWIGLPAAPSGRFRPRHWNVQPPNRFSLLISIFVFLCPCGFCSFMMAVFFPLPTVIEAFVMHLNLLMHL